VHSFSLAASQSAHKVLGFLGFIECRKRYSAACIARRRIERRFTKIVVPIAQSHRQFAMSLLTGRVRFHPESQKLDDVVLVRALIVHVVTPAISV
jgi:hypothetical protein